MGGQNCKFRSFLNRDLTVLYNFNLTLTVNTSWYKDPISTDDKKPLYEYYTNIDLYFVLKG